MEKILDYLLSVGNEEWFFKCRTQTRTRRNNMTQTTVSTAAEIAATLPVEELQALLVQKQGQQGLDRLKAIVESTDPAHKDIQAALLKKVKVWDRKNTPKRAYTGKKRGPKPGSKKSTTAAHETAPTA